LFSIAVQFPKLDVAGSIPVSRSSNQSVTSQHVTVIEDLAEVTGGRAFFPDSVDELEDICSRIAVELKNQYVLGYHSTNGAKDGKWRKIRLKVDPPKGMSNLSVRGKTGYYAERLNTRP